MNNLDYNWDSRLYNEKHSFVYDYGKALINLLNPGDNERILDLGCGTGHLTFEISKIAKGTIGLDSSPDMIKTARLNFPGLEFQLKDASDFHFKEHFDAIFSNATLHWVLDYKAAINCMFSNLKPGGRLVVEFGGKGNVQIITGQLRKMLNRRGYTNQSELQIWYFPSISEYTTYLEEVGFEVVFAQLYDRPTELSDEKTGIKDWISMFGNSFFNGVTAKDKEEVLTEVQEGLKPVLFKEGKWYADYKRLRVVAIKRTSNPDILSL
jgi:trans-aconitate methyltransferase